jgi:hypothetical protein
MEVSGQLYAPAALPPVKQPSIFTGQEAGWVPAVLPVAISQRPASALHDHLTTITNRLTLFREIPAVCEDNLKHKHNLRANYRVFF